MVGSKQGGDALAHGAWPRPQQRARAEAPPRLSLKRTKLSDNTFIHAIVSRK